MGLILDSSVLIAAERGKFAFDDFLMSLQGESCFMASITLSEMWHGYHRGGGAMLERRLAYIRSFEARIPALPFGAEEALIHSKIWAHLEETGQKIGPHDFLIAATALAHDHSVATLNESEFNRVPGLRLASVRRFVLK